MSGLFPWEDYGRKETVLDEAASAVEVPLSRNF